MIIPDLEYELTDRGSYYGHSEGTVYIGLPNDHTLTDDEVIEFTADSITHEVVHHVLKCLFGELVTCLFDAIGDKFRRIELTRKCFGSYDGVQVWADAIEEDGFGRLIDEYWLDRDEVVKVLREGC